MQVALSHFGGIVPRLADHKLGPTQATIAHDVKLRNGVLEAWRTPLRIADTVSHARAFHMYGCCPLSWAENVVCAELAPDWGRLYLTRGNGLEVAEAIDCVPRYYRAGIPAPSGQLHAAAQETCGPEVDARSYLYTYINQWGEESAPSQPSNVVRVDDDAAVTLSGFTLPSEDFGVVGYNLYRSTTGFRPSDGKVQEPLTEYLFVAQLPVATTVFQDTVRGAYLGAALETQYDRMPPEGMQGVTAIGDQVRLAGFRGNRIFISEAFQPHNWPAKYELTLDYDIVHLLSLDQRLFATTTSTPYIIDVSNCDATKCTPVTSIDFPLADIGCQYPHAAIMTYHGMFYATQYGLLLLQPDGSWHIATARWFGEDEWRKLKPSTIRMAHWEGYLFFATDKATFLLDMNGQPYGNMEGAELVTLSDRPLDMAQSNTGQLLFLQDDAIWMWDAGPQYREYIWQSRPLTSGPDAAGQSQLASGNPARAAMWWPTSVKLGGNAHFSLIDSHEHIAFVRFLTREKPRRLPRCGRHLWYKARVSGNDTVQFLDVGTSHFTVNSGS